MPTFNIPLFRTQFPEFSDLVLYPTEMISFWAAFASVQVVQCRWGNQYIMGVSLYVAHEITLASQNSKTAQFGGMPGSVSGIANTKTVGGATVGYDAATTTEKDSGYWNKTNYGQQFIRLARMFGAGAIQL